MDITGIDVSSYQGKIDWAKVKEDGIDFAILKIIRKDLSKDKYFEDNWNGCINANVAIQGVYNYSYATSVAMAMRDAKRVVEILGDRKTFVWLDVEDSCQKGLNTLLLDIIREYGKVIKASGNQFGVYTGQYFYNTYIKPYGILDCPLWIASYGLNTGVPQNTKRPSMANVLGWQYTSRGNVKGVSGNVDMNLWFSVIDKEETNPYNEPILTIKKGSKGSGAAWVQWELNHHGYVLDIDGIFGILSDRALRQFQTDKGLVVDGKCGRRTKAAFKNEK